MFPLSTMFSSLCSFSNLSSVFFKLSFLSSCSPLCHYPSLFLQNFATPHWFCSLPCIYRQLGERFTIPCLSAGHGGMGVAGYGCVGVGMGHAGFLGKWGGEREGKNSGKNFQKSPSPLSLHLQGRRSCTVPFKTAPCSFFCFFFHSFFF